MNLHEISQYAYQKNFLVMYLYIFGIDDLILATSKTLSTTTHIKNDEDALARIQQCIKKMFGQ